MNCKSFVTPSSSYDSILARAVTATLVGKCLCLPQLTRKARDARAAQAEGMFEDGLKSITC